MAYTQDQITALEQAIAQGATHVKYADKEINYRSLADMRSLLIEMKRSVGSASKKSHVNVYSAKGMWK